MKKISLGLLIIFVVLGIGTILLSQFKQKIDSALSVQPTPQKARPTPTPSISQAKTITTELFVPYWGLGKGSGDFSSYDKLIYFGIAVNEKGVRKDEQGYTSLPVFQKAAQGKHSDLTVRMLENSSNFAILKNKEAQERVIRQSIDTAKEYGFEGILLDLELTALPFDSLMGQIKEFNKLFATEVRNAGLSYSFAAYGDTFYRLRPFDIENMARYSDQVYIMAYDFHKAKGNPGPNFPLRGNETYGYDYHEMIEQFLEAVPATKLTVIFGLYGYDWTVNDKGESDTIASPISFNDAQAKLITSCRYQSCSWKRDSVSGEVEVRYIDDAGKQHIVWFEDKVSVRRKQEFLQTRGIGSSAYWAYSYF